MARYLHTVALPNADLPASTNNAFRFDLPVNPLSLILLRLQITNVAPAALLTYSAIDDAITQLTAVRILHKGEQIISGSLRDLIGVNAVYQRAYPWAATAVRTDNAVRSFVFPICLGRRAYDPQSCFPATTRGNLIMEGDTGADGAGYDDINVSVETVELIEANPTEYLKYVRQARDSVIGQFDARLPIGNPLLGILLFDTGLAASSDEVLSWGQVKLLKDNVEQYISVSEYETLAGMLGMQMASAVALFLGHAHQINDGAALSQSDDAEQLLSQGLQGYAYMDFDPLRDGQYQLETEGAADLLIRGVGDEATAIRYYPIERVSVR